MKKQFVFDFEKPGIEKKASIFFRVSDIFKSNNGQIIFSSEWLS